MKRKKETVFKPWDVMYYYVRKEGHRVGVVALYVVPPTSRLPGARTMYCRGMSICSVHDQFDAQKGKAEALGRCRRAFYSRTNQEPIIVPERRSEDRRTESVRRFVSSYEGYATNTIYKSAFTSRLSRYERKIVDGHAKAALGIQHPRQLPFVTGEMKLIKTGPFAGMYQRVMSKEEGE